MTGVGNDGRRSASRGTQIITGGNPSKSTVRVAGNARRPYALSVSEATIRSTPGPDGARGVRSSCRKGLSMHQAPSLAPVPRSGTAADVLRVVSDPRTPVFLTEHSGGRLRYGYWRSPESDTGRGGCYVALPTEVCEELRHAGHIVLDDPVQDPAKITYRVCPARREPRAGQARVAETARERSRERSQSVDPGRPERTARPTPPQPQRTPPEPRRRPAA